MSSDAIIDSNLFVRLDLDHSLKANILFQTDPVNRAHIASQLLLYNKVIIPTMDFGIIPILINWFGEKQFEKLLEESTLEFIRRYGFIAYCGGGLGINQMIIRPGEKDFSWWQEALFGDINYSIEVQIKYMCPSIGQTQRQKLCSMIASRSHILTYTNDLFMKQIVHESYTDIMSDEKLSKFILEKTKPKDKIVNLAQINEVKPNQTIVLTMDGKIRNTVDLILRVAEINLELLMSMQVKEADISTSNGAEKILSQKVLRAGLDKSLMSGFIKLLDLNNIPDIRPAIITGGISLSKILTIRQKDVSRKFRRWLKEADIKDSRELERAYVAALGRKTWADALPLTGLRFALTTAIGMTNPVTGLLANAIDAFFVSQWLDGYSPKLFLDKLRLLDNTGDKL